MFCPQAHSRTARNHQPCSAWDRDHWQPLVVSEGSRWEDNPWLAPGADLLSWGASEIRASLHQGTADAQLCWKRWVEVPRRCGPQQVATGVHQYSYVSALWVDTHRSSGTSWGRWCMQNTRVLQSVIPPYTRNVLSWWLKVVEIASNGRERDNLAGSVVSSRTCCFRPTGVTQMAISSTFVGWPKSWMK